MYYINLNTISLSNFSGKIYVGVLSQLADYIPNKSKHRLYRYYRIHVALNCNPN